MSLAFQHDNPMQEWNGLPYHAISVFYQKTFGERVYKIPVNIADTCPNRLGLKGMKTCIFCDEWGSSADNRIQDLPLQEQIDSVKAKLKGKFQNKKKHLVYFQAYTNTFLRFDVVKNSILQALADPDTAGVVIGTRPDCLSKSLLELWNEVSQKHFLAVELGVQSFRDDVLRFYERGHSVEDSLRAIRRIAELPRVNLGLHLMFGAPGENESDVIEAARRCNQLPIQNVKLHNLHVLKNTPLAELHAEKKFNPIDLETYTQWTSTFLQHLDPRIAVHRLSGYAPRWDELVAPAWTAHRMRVYQYMLDHFRAHRIVQGQKFSSSCEAQNSTSITMYRSRDTGPEISRFKMI